MAAIGTGWADGAWVFEAWVTAGDGAWSQEPNTAPENVERVKPMLETAVNMMDH